MFSINRCRAFLLLCLIAAVLITLRTYAFSVSRSSFDKPSRRPSGQDKQNVGARKSSDSYNKVNGDRSPRALTSKLTKTNDKFEKLEKEDYEITTEFSRLSEEERLQKVMARAGVASRRDAERMVSLI